jgi:hypothetical protein
MAGFRTMRLRHLGRVIPGIVPVAGTIAALFFSSLPAFAQKERSGGILRGLIHTIAPGSPEDLEQQARTARDVPTALDVYETLESRFSNRPEGVRAAIWVGLYYYGRNDVGTALSHFERARSGAQGSYLLARASFWCDQARLMTGSEPIGPDRAEDTDGFWGALRALTRVDRAIQADRRGEAEASLLSIEGAARRAGLLGPEVARWGDVLRMPGPGGRTNQAILSPILRATAELPERLLIKDPAPPADKGRETETWAVQFGAFLESENAEALAHVLKSRGIESRIDEGEQEGRRWYRVRLAETSDRPLADSLCRRIQGETGIACQSIRVR